MLTARVLQIASARCFCSSQRRHRRASIGAARADRPKQASPACPAQELRTLRGKSTGVGAVRQHSWPGRAKRRGDGQDGSWITPMREAAPKAGRLRRRYLARFRKRAACSDPGNSINSTRAKSSSRQRENAPRIRTSRRPVCGASGDLHGMSGRERVRVERSQARQQADRSRRNIASEGQRGLAT